MQAWISYLTIPQHNTQMQIAISQSENAVFLFEIQTSRRAGNWDFEPGQENFGLGVQRNKTKRVNFKSECIDFESEALNFVSECVNFESECANFVSGRANIRQGNHDYGKESLDFKSE